MGNKSSLQLNLLLPIPCFKIHLQAIHYLEMFQQQLLEPHIYLLLTLLLSAAASLINNNSKAILQDQLNSLHQLLTPALHQK